METKKRVPESTPQTLNKDTQNLSNCNKINDLSIESNGINPSELIKKYLEFNKMCDFLKCFDFESENEIEKAIFYFSDKVVKDSYCNSKEKREDNPDVRALYNQFNTARNGLGKLEKYATQTAQSLWVSYFSRLKLDKQVKQMFCVKPDNDKFLEGSKKLQDIYSFSDLHIEMIRYFVCQVKDKDSKPSNNKELYFWSKTKRTGKTTVASILISILNGENDTRNIGKYSQNNLGVELQMNTFDVPLVTTCNAVLMDEVMFRDMGKVYPRFKGMITSQDCKVDIKYGTAQNVKCKRNYIFTSNEPIETFVKDTNDRRFLVVDFNKIPQPIGETELFNLWRDFVINCIPLKPMNDWYEDLSEKTEVKGGYQFEIDDLIHEIKDKSFLDRLKQEVYKSNDKRFTLKSIRDTLSGEKYSQLKNDLLLEASKEVFGKPDDKRRWKIDVIESSLLDYPVIDNNQNDSEETLPF